MQKARPRGSNVYKVERLVDSRTRGNRTEYLVKWKNWSDSHNTWEPSKNILDKRLIESFLRREKRKKEQLPKEIESNESDRNVESDHDTSTDIDPITDPQASNELLSALVQSVQISSPESIRSPTLSDTGFSSPPVLTNALSSPFHSSSHTDPIIIANVPTSPGSTKSTSRSLFSSETVSSLINPSTSVTATTTTSTSTSSSSCSSSSSTTLSAISTITTATTNTTMTVATATTPTTTSETSDWSSDRRFRKTTLLVAAASASAAHAAAALASSRNATKHAHSNASSSSSLSSIHGQEINRQVTTQNQSILTTTTTTTTSTTTTTITSTTTITTTSTVTESNSEERPKIRLTIPRERLLAACLPSNNSTTNLNQIQISSKSISSHDEPMLNSIHDVAKTMDEHPKFLAPVEIPRRGLASSPHLISPTAGLRLSDMAIDHGGFDSEFLSKSPKWEKHSSRATSPTQLPKLVLFASEQNLTKKRQRQSSDSDSIIYHTIEHESKRKKHAQKKEKRKKHRDHDPSSSVHRFDSDSYESPSYHYINPNKIRRRSGSSTSHTSTLSSDSFSPSIPSTSPSTEDVPRLAPLRIQLPRSVASQLSAPGSLSSLTDSRSNSDYFNRKYSVPSFPIQNRLRDPNRSQNSIGLSVLSPNSKHLRLVQEMCVTDITVGGLTISIKECSKPDNFFGVPSSQLVKLNGSSSKFDPPFLLAKNTDGLDRDSNSPTSKVPNTETNVSVEPNQISSTKTYADENVAPNTDKTTPRPNVPMDHISPLPRHKDRELPQLSVIYEESSGELSLPSANGYSESRPVSPPNPQNPQPSTTPSIKIEKTTDADDEMLNNSTGSTSALVLAANEAAEKVASESPSSPGLLLPPRRASTPVEHTPPYPPKCPTPCDSSSDIPMEPPVTVSSNSLVVAPPVLPKRSVSSSLQSTTVPRKVLISKLTPSSPQTRPMATIFGQVRGRGAPPLKTSNNSQEPRKSRSKLGTHASHQSPTSSSSTSPVSSTNTVRVTAPSRPVVCVRSSQADRAQKPCDPSSVYAFTGDSPTYSSPRTNSKIPGDSLISRVNSNSSIRAKSGGKIYSSNSVASLKNFNSDLQSCSSDSNPPGNFSALLSFQQSLTLPNPVSNVSTLPVSLPSLSCPMPGLSSPDNALATAFCLQQLQMQLMCPSSAAAAAAAAALINAMSSSSFSSNPFCSVSCPPQLSSSQLNVSTTIGSTNAQNRSQSHLTPTFPSAVNLPLFPTDSNLLNSVHASTISTAAPSLPFPMPLHLTDIVGNSNISLASAPVVGDTNDLPIDLSSKR